MIHEVKSSKYRPTSKDRTMWRNQKIKEEGKTTRSITTVTDDDGVSHIIVRVVKPETKSEKTKTMVIINVDNLEF